MIKTADFDYELPEERIAQTPADRREGSRMLVLGTKGAGTSDLRFSDLPGLLRAGDLLVLNDTEVFPARLMAERESGGRVEIFLLEFPSDPGWVGCLVRPGRKIRDMEVLTLEDGNRVTIHRDGENFLVRSTGGDLVQSVRRVGRVPLPPYIRRVESSDRELDRERYQTVYARNTGAVAAPTAGLHLTEEMLEEIRKGGVRIEYLTLHVGPGTFQPVRAENIADHTMEEEWYSIPRITADAVNGAKKDGSRVVAVGTTVVRTLESAFSDGRVMPGQGSTDLFIYPGFRFNVVDALLTNFHLPMSTLLMLVCAFGGIERVLAAYREAVDRDYRFYSYGDAMFLERQESGARSQKLGE